MQYRKIVVATIIGWILFITDLNTGWMSFALAGIPSIFIIVFVVGIISGDAVSGLVSGLLASFGGVALVALIPDILLPAHPIATTDYFLRMLVVMAMSVAYATEYATEPVPWIIAPIIVAILVLISPFVFGMSVLFGLLGGLIGKPIYSRIFKSDQPMREQRSFQAPGPPASHEPPPEDSPEPQVAPEEEGEPLETEGEDEGSNESGENY